MRGKRAAVNSLFSLFQEVASIICAFVLPRLILTSFGSEYNGLTTSITQFLACAVLLRSGIGRATRAALYKPIAEHNQDEINGIVKATDIFMRKIALILLGLIVGFALIYPFLVQNDFGWFFTFSLFLIIGASTFAESFFGITYLAVLQANQNFWFPAILHTICILLNTVVAAVLINLGQSIHIVKLGSAVIFVAYPIIQNIYVRKRYNIDTNVKPNNKAISQRWDAFWHQTAEFVTNNTDIVVLTVFTNMLEVSVYSVYNLINNGLKRGIHSFTNGLEAAFGNMIAKNEYKTLETNVRITENLLFFVSTIVYSCTSLLIFDFISIYTSGVNDVNYIRPVFAYIMICAQFFDAIRIPYQLVVQAAGHYKQTKIGAIIEPVINIVISVILVIKFGLVGVAVGTLCATIFRTIQYSLYMSKNIVKRSPLIVIKRLLLSFCECAIIIAVVKLINLPTPTGYLGWVINACLSLLISVFVVSIGNYLFFRNDMKGTIMKLKNIMKRRNKQREG